MLIAVINKSKRISNSDTALMTAACNAQMAHDVAPFWRKFPTAVIQATEATIPDGAAPIYLFDVADDPNALGWHTEDAHGRIYGKVFVNPILDNGGTVLHGPNSVLVTLSHEAIEADGDPSVNRWAEGPRGRLYADEWCDPVEADAYDISIMGKMMSVSNFIGPAWRDATPPAHSKFDFLGKLHAPFTMTKGGYMVYRTAGAEHQTFGRVVVEYGEEYPEWKKAGKHHAAARTARRGAW